MEDQKSKTVSGITAPPPRPTIIGALLFALITTAPFAVVILLFQWLF